MKNYYEEIMEKINQEVSNNNYDEAFRIVSEELNAPYVPQDFEKQLEDIYQTITKELKFKSNRSGNWNIEKVLEIMSKKIDQEVHLMAFDALRGLNARLIMEDIKHYLLDENMKSEYKTFLILVLIEQGIDQELTVKKNNVSITINPCKLNIDEVQESLKDIELKIEKVVYDTNPSLFTICQHIVNSYFYYAFPIFNFEKDNKNDLAMAIIMKALDSLGIQLEEETEFKLEFNKENTMLLLNELNKII